MTDLPARFTIHTVQVRDVDGGAGMGSTAAASRDVSAFVVDEQRMVQGPDGVEVVSNTQVSVNLNDPTVIGSLVTVWAGEVHEREAKVVAIGTFSHDRLPSHRTLFLA